MLFFFQLHEDCRLSPAHYAVLSYISLTTTFFFCFCAAKLRPFQLNRTENPLCACLLIPFSAFLQCIKVFLTCLRLITLVLAIPRSKKNAFALLGPNYTVLSLSALHKGFRPFAAYHAASRYISLIRTFFCCCGATLRCVQRFRTGNGFCLFGANRAVLSCFGSLLPYFQLFCT